MRCNPQEHFPRLFEEWNVSVLAFESDIEPYAVTRDEKVISHAKKANVTVIQEYSHTIFNPELVIQRNKGSVPMTYQKYLSIVSELRVPKPEENPQKLSTKHKPPLDSEENVDEECYDVPTLEELGVNEYDVSSESLFPGGETEALWRLEDNLKKVQWICAFEKPNTSPNSLEPSTTVLSPYLKFGCLSSRLFYQKLKDVYKGRKHSQPPTSLEGQLIWREYYYTAAAGTPYFDKMIGNKICVQIPWKTNQVYLKAWRDGMTGYPFIDACMRQLKQEGWIHHLARHAVACFLTRGDLWCHWEDGMKVFEEYLLDADWALNAANWMWLSASAFFHQYYRVYSPIAFGKKTDPEGKFIRKYVPELENYPKNLIYEPWKATMEQQKQFKCIIGKDYPKPIVDHDKAMKENMEKMKKAYAAKNSGKREAESPPAASSSKKNSIDKYFK